MAFLRLLLLATAAPPARRPTTTAGPENAEAEPAERAMVQRDRTNFMLLFVLSSLILMIPTVLDGNCMYKLCKMMFLGTKWTMQRGLTHKGGGGKEGVVSDVLIPHFPPPPFSKQVEAFLADEVFSQHHHPF